MNDSNFPSLPLVKSDGNGGYRDSSGHFEPAQPWPLPPGIRLLHGGGPLPTEELSSPYVPLDLRWPTSTPRDLESIVCRAAGVDSPEQFASIPRLPFAALAIHGRHNQDLFEAEFIRDALIGALATRHIWPELLLGVVRRCFELLGPEGVPHEVRPLSDRIAQELMAQHGIRPTDGLFKWFCSVDATPLLLIAAAHAETYRPGFLQQYQEKVDFCLDLVLQRTGPEHNFLLETPPASNGCWQVWRDSFDAYHHADGRLAQGQVCADEVMAYVHEALTLMADLGVSKKHSGSRLLSHAGNVQAALLEHMWVRPSDGTPGFLAIGTERNVGVLRQIAVRTSNMALPLEFGILTGKQFSGHVSAIQDNIVAMALPCGIPTVVGTPRVHPEAYHNGSIWPWVDFAIARGFRNHGRHAFGRELAARTMRVCHVLECNPEKLPGTASETPALDAVEVRVNTVDAWGRPLLNAKAQRGQITQVGFTTQGHAAALEHERQIRSGAEPACGKGPAFAEDIRALAGLVAKGQNLYADHPGHVLHAVHSLLDSSPLDRPQQIDLGRSTGDLSL